MNTDTTVLIALVTAVLIALAAGYIVYRILRKTLRLAFRTAIVATVFAAIAIGSFSLYWFAGSGKSASKPGVQGTRK